MKIIVNTATTFQGGGVQVARSFIEECKTFTENEYHIVLGERLSGLINKENYSDNFFFYNVNYRPATRIFSWKSHNRDLKNIEERVNPDVVFTTSGPAYWRPKVPHLVGYNRAHYLYSDSLFFSQISFYERIRWFLEGKTLKFFFRRDADAYVVQTDDVNHRLRRWLKNDKVHTVSNTHSRHYNDPQNVANKLPESSQDEFRFLAISAWHTHKNLKIIPKVVEALPEKIKQQIRFILTLPDKKFKENFPSDMKTYIKNVGPVKPEEAPVLYRECDALFLPTLLECFSASYPEAMKMEKPIITSDLDFAHAICGDAALYADPLNPNDIAEKIAELVGDPNLRDKLVRNGIEQLNTFDDAKERAEKYLNICKEMVDTNKLKKRSIVVVNQAVNYLTVGLCNAFTEKFGQIGLITGNIHEQGEELDESVKVSKINKWIEKPAWKKMISYLWACVQIYWRLLTRYRKCDVFFISLPPMAYLMSIVLPNRCSMLIWDVYPDIFKITGMKESHPLYRIWAGLNRIAFKRAYKLYTIGGKMADLLSNYVDHDKIKITPIWSIFQFNGKVTEEENPFVIQQELQGKFVVQYSGNIGLTHNVEVMVKLAERMKENEDILFQIIGRGARKPHIKSLVEERNLSNCQFLPFQSDEMFPYSLSAADLGVVILDEAASKGSIPSKSYNLMSYGIPALYVASDDSELSEYAKKYEHAKCINHHNLDEAEQFILDLKTNKELKKKYSANALKASQNYRRSNADKIVEYYLNGTD